MFIPLKVLLLLSNAEEHTVHIPLTDITFDKITYITSLLMLTGLLYVFYFIVKFFGSKVYNGRIREIKKK